MSRCARSRSASGRRRPGRSTAISSSARPTACWRSACGRATAWRSSPTNRPEWLVADAGAVAARAVTIGLDPAAESEDLLRNAGARVLIAEDQEQVDKALAGKAELPELEWIVYLEPRGVRDYAEASLVWWPDLLARGEEHSAEHPRLLDELAADVTGDDPVTLAVSAREVNARWRRSPTAVSFTPNRGPATSCSAICRWRRSPKAEQRVAERLRRRPGPLWRAGRGPRADAERGGALALPRHAAGLGVAPRQGRDADEPAPGAGGPQAPGDAQVPLRSVGRRAGRARARDWYRGLGIPVRRLGTELVGEAG